MPSGYFFRVRVGFGCHPLGFGSGSGVGPRVPFGFRVFSGFSGCVSGFSGCVRGFSGFFGLCSGFRARCFLFFVTGVLHIRGDGSGRRAANESGNKNGTLK